MGTAELLPFERRYLKHVEENLVKRLKLVAYFEQHEEERQRELELCGHDFLHWVNRWGWSYNPHMLALGRDGKVPFVLVKRQAELARWVLDRIERREDGVIEKSRDQGVTWIMAAISVWLFLNTNSKIAVGSRKEELVDRFGDPDTLLEKCRFIISMLPAWMQDRTLDLVSRSMFLENRRTGAVIKGEGGDNIGRGGRNTLYWVDEHAFLPHAELVESALATNAPTVIRISTPSEFGHVFDGLIRAGIPTFRFHWSENELCDKSWYEYWCAKCGNDPVRIGRELDIRRDVSIDEFLIPQEWLDAATAATSIPLGDTDDSIAGFDIAGSGSANNAVVVRIGNHIKECVDWHGSNDISLSVMKAVEIARSHGVQRFAFDAIGVGLHVESYLRDIDGITFESTPVTVSNQPTFEYIDDGRNSRDVFLNLKAQLWWALRTRCKNTFGFLNGATNVDTNKLLCIPDDKDLKLQLLLPKMSFTAAGKLKVESKRSIGHKMDLADALVLTLVGDVGVGAVALAPLADVTESEEVSRRSIVHHVRQDLRALRRPFRLFARKFS